MNEQLTDYLLKRVEAIQRERADLHKQLAKVEAELAEVQEALKNAKAKKAFAG